MTASEPKPVLGWRLYLTDGRVIDSRQSSWEDAPAKGVACVVVYYKATYTIHRDGRDEVENYLTLLQGGDYYWRQGDLWYTGTAAECADANPEHVKIGAWMFDADWLALYNTALNDATF